MRQSPTSGSTNGSRSGNRLADSLIRFRRGGPPFPPRAFPRKAFWAPKTVFLQEDLMSHVISKVARKLTSMRMVDGRKLHSLPEQEHLKRLLSHLEIDCVFDVGANVGQYATMLRKHAGYKGRIISF